MVVSTFQGFDKDLNLKETQVDRDFLNNLGGAPIADDIGLFVNNNRNFSSINVQSSQISGDTITFPLDVTFAYTEGTTITIDGTPYSIFDVSINENDEITIRLKNASDVIVANPPSGDYIRNDAVSYDNVTNLVRYRDVVVEDTALSLVFFSDDAEDITDQNSRNVYSSLINVFNKYATYPATLKDYLSSIEINIDYANSKRANSIVKNRDFSTTYKTEINGVAVVKDEDGLNDTSVSSSNPGIFILNTATGSFARIFSSNENVWEKIGSDLVADTKEISIQNLVFEDEIKLETNGVSITTTESGDVTSDFTHFMKVLINGEEYYLCMKPDV